MEEVDSRQFKVQSKQRQNLKKSATFVFQLSTVDFFFSQHSPGGIGFPWGQVLGWPRKVQMR
jgi:hypothetical protein